MTTEPAISHDNPYQAGPAWRDFASAPKNGTVFLALNHDGEVWVAKYSDDPEPRLMFRMNDLYEPRKFLVHEIEGKRLLEEDKDYAQENEAWRSYWCLWASGYEFRPVYWMALSRPPKIACSRSATAEEQP